MNLTNIRFDNAAWSPDGLQLAWTISGEFIGQGDYQAGVVLFDFPTRTHWLIHNYALTGGGSFSNPVSWSPAGHWLAAVLHNDIPGRRSSTLWLMQTNGSQQHSVSDASYPVWKPDGTALAFTQWPDSAQGNFSAQSARIVLMQMENWTTEIVSLPPGIILLDWILLP